MIGFWIAAGLLTVATVSLLAVPLMRRRVPSAPSAEADLAVYRDQLDELGRDRARGLVEADQAEALEAEIGRRMLAAARSVAVVPAEAAPARRLATGLAMLVPICAFAVYLAIGHPDLPGQPLAERAISPDSDPAKVLAAVDRVKGGLKPVKEDLDRWVMVAEAYGRLGRPADSVSAFRIAVSLAPDDPALKAALAESLVQAASGRVGDEAKQLFQTVPADSPALPEARFYLAAAEAQAGNWKAALAGWQALLASSPADASYVDAVRERIAVAARSLGLDPAMETPEPRPASAQPGAQSGPSAADVQAAEQMTPDQRMAMIRSMVAGLAAKLEANPDDADGWRRLARAYQVLGDGDKAKDALARAAAAETKKAAP